MRYEARYMTGKCANGAGRDAGPRWHAVAPGAYHTDQALCGRAPKIQWSEPRSIVVQPVTCPVCARRLEREKREDPTAAGEPEYGLGYMQGRGAS